MVSDKGKQPAGKSSGKRKLDDDKSGGINKRKNRGVLQFFDEAAGASDGGSSSGDSIFDDDFFEEEELDLGTNIKNDQFKSHNLPVFPKEEEFEEEFDKIMEERYKNVPAFLRFAADEHNIRRFVEEDSSIPSITDPTTWKVKCAVGRERHSAFCLMQKYADLQTFGDKLKIISAYAVEHVKGHFFIEAEKQSEVTESCRGLCSVYATRVTPVPRSEVPHLLSVRSRRVEISEGMWARVKNGTYKGDLAQVVAVNDARRRVTVKLIPRIDFQAMAEKFGGGSASKRTGAPAPKLISSSELDEFRPLIQYRRDRDTGNVFQVLDGLMLKDGYLYKRVAIDSLSFWGVMPSDEELLKFQPPENKESSEVEWLAQLYGDKKKKRTIKYEKGGEKGEGSSSSSSTKKYELYDLVSLGQKDFGVIVGVEKDDYKILKEGTEGHIVQNVGVHEIKNGPIDAKFTAMDQHRKPISVNDTVRIMEGPLKDRQGIVRQIYRGIIFIYDDNEVENGGYICSKAQYCEKIKLSVDSFPGKGGEPSSFIFDDAPSSPKSPLSPEKSWQARENKRDFNQGERDGFSVGQTLRIRVGPLKGYTCRVIAVRRSDITVKLDSQRKVLTVKSEHLAEVRGRSSAMSMREETDSGSIKPFNLLGNEGSTDWTGGTGASANDGGWNSGGSSAPWSSWSSLPSSGLAAENNSVDPSSLGDDSQKDVEDDGWGSKITQKQNSSWGTTTADDQVVSGNDQSDGWQKDGDSWNKATVNGSSSGIGSDSWGKAIPQNKGSALSSKEGGGSWGNAAVVTWGRNNGSGKSDDSSWNKQKSSAGDGGSSWNSWNKRAGPSWSEAADGTSKDRESWGNANQKMKASDISFPEKTKDENNSWTSWKKSESSLEKGKAVFGSEGWGKKGGFSQESKLGNSSWDRPRGGFEQGGDSSLEKDGGSWKKQDGGSSWGNSADRNREDGDSLSSKYDSTSWDKTSAGTSWNKDHAGDSWNKQEGGSSWGKTYGDSLQNKQDIGSWNDQSGGSKQNAGSSWNNNNDGSSWNNLHGGSPWNKSAAVSDDRGSWMNDGSVNKQEEDASWSKNTGGSSWNKSKEDASWGKKVASSWGQQDRGSSWSQQTGSSFRDKRGNEDQDNTFGGSGERRGRGGRGRGGRGFRGRFGRGRSFDQDQSSGCKEGGGRGSMSGSGGWSSGARSGERGSWSFNPGDSTGSWNRGGSDNQTQMESWSRPNSFGADGGSSLGGTQEKGSSWSNQGGGTWKDAGENNGSGSAGGSWGKDRDSTGAWNRPKSWNTPKASDVGGSSWDCHQVGDSSKSTDGDEGGWKKPEANSWGKKKEDTGAENNWGNANDSSGGWKKPEGDSWVKRKEDSGVDAWYREDKKNDAGESSWNRGGGSWNNKQDEDSSQKKHETDSWGKKKGTGADNNWGNVNESSGGWKKPEGDSSWGKKTEDSGVDDKNNAGGSSWNRGGDSWNNEKQDEDSLWGRKRASGGSSWSVDKQDEGDCSWGSKQGAVGSLWNNTKQDGGGGDSSLGSKQGSDGSFWNTNKQDGGNSSWKAGRCSCNSDGGGEDGSAVGSKAGESSWNM